MTPRHIERRQLFLIPLAAFVAVLPLSAHGCSCGHDFDFHLLNWMEAARQFSHGNLYPHWAYTPAFNAGEPRFVFYPPLSWYLGALIGLALTHLPGVTEAAAWSATPIVFTWIALALSGVTIYRLARTFVSSNAALLAATLYLANPYMLFTAYERTAYAELLAAAWIPLLFHAILRERVTIPSIALPVALLWLTNAPAAVMGSYTLALLAAIRVIGAYRIEAALATQAILNSSKSFPPETWVSRHRSSLHLAFKAFASTTLGLALAAFYIVPAAYERRFVQIAMVTIAGMRIDQNFLFEHTGTSSDALLHDQVLHTASLIAILLLTATAIALAVIFVRVNLSSKVKPYSDRSSLQRYRESRDEGISATIFPTVTLAILMATIAFLLTPLSLPIWNHTPQATFLQFPWRLLAVLAPIFALTLARSLTKSPGAPSIASLRSGERKTFAVTAVVLTTAAILIGYNFFHQPCDFEDTAAARLALFHSSAGTDPTDEYTPTTADNDALNPNDPPYWLAATPDDGPPPTAVQTGSPPMNFTITAPQAEVIILNLRDYPSWRVSLNNAPDPTHAQRTDGLIAIAIPPGQSTINIRYAHTMDQTIGDGITLIALVLIVIIRRAPPPTRSRT